MTIKKLVNLVLGNGLIVLYAAIASVGLIFLKAGAPNELILISNGGMVWNINPLAIAGIVAYGISFLLYTILISRNDLGYIVTVSTSLIYLIVFLASFTLFGEKFTILKILGIFFILMGLFLLNTDKKLFSRLGNNHA